MSKAIAIGYLTKVSLANVNSSHNEGNVMVAKKKTMPDGTTYPYISGQAIRRMLRDRLADLGYELSEPFAKVSGQQVTPPCDPEKFVDEDLFGYLDPSGGRRRTSPVRVSAAVGLFPFQGDRDLGTRSFERFGESVSAGGNMFETEIYANLFKGNLLVELDRVGVFMPAEIAKKETDKEGKKKSEQEKPEEKKPVVLSESERQKRLRDLLEALALLWGGGRTARMLADLSPKFVVYMRLQVKHPVFLEALSATYENGRYYIELKPLLKAIEKFERYQDHLLVGVEPGIFGNEAEIRATFGDKCVGTASEALREAAKDAEKIWAKGS